MKKLSKLVIMSFGVLAVTSGLAMAESTSFTPLNFGDNKPITTTPTAKTTSSGPVLLDPSQVTGGNKMQNAILQLDNAQVEVRNQLLQYRNSYTNIDNQYQTTKAERKAAKKRIRQSEKQVKNLEKAKNKIRKNFEQKNNV